jgi:hypothetical protein
MHRGALRDLSDVARAIVDGVEASTVEVVRGGEARVQMIATSLVTPVRLLAHCGRGMGFFVRLARGRDAASTSRT